jgi:hypothetical protein
MRMRTVMTGSRMIYLYPTEDINMGKSLLSVVAIAALVFLSLSVGARAYFYDTFTDCGTGLGANGTIITCESPPIMIPPDCIFGTIGVGPGNRINLHQYGEFQGTCAGDPQYVRAYLPDTVLKQQFLLYCDQTPWMSDFYLNAPQTVLSGYGDCIPSTQISCAMHNRLNLGCWRNSTELMVNGGFETSYTTIISAMTNQLRGASANTYVPNWFMPDNSTYGSYLASGDWWGMTGSKYLLVTTNGSAVTSRMSLTQPIYFPPDLGSLYNVSYNMNATVELGSPAFCLPTIESYIVFPDNTTFNLQTLDYSPYPESPGGCTSYTPCPVYNGTYSQTVNIGNKTGDAHIYFRVGCSGSDIFYLDEFRLDAVSVTSDCVGTSPNCTTELEAPGPGSCSEDYLGVVANGYNFSTGYCGSTTCSRDGCVWDHDCAGVLACHDSSWSCGYICLNGTSSNITTTTTTFPCSGPTCEAGQQANDLITMGVQFVAAAMGTDMSGARMLIWVILSMVIFFGVIYAEVSTGAAQIGAGGWQAPLVVALLFFAAGGILNPPWVPPWIDIVMVIIAGYIVVQWGRHLGGGG